MASHQMAAIWLCRGNAGAERDGDSPKELGGTKDMFMSRQHLPSSKAVSDANYSLGGARCFVRDQYQLGIWASHGTRVAESKARLSGLTITSGSTTLTRTLIPIFSETYGQQKREMGRGWHATITWRLSFGCGPLRFSYLRCCSKWLSGMNCWGIWPSARGANADGKDPWD